MNASIRKLTILSLLTALSLALFSIELVIPPFPFSPSSKIGLANTVTLFMITKDSIFCRKDCFFVMLSRCILGALITGRLLSVLFSLTGGIVSMLFMFLARKILGSDSVVLISVTGAIFHNVSQMITAVCIYGVFSSFYYLPVLLVTGILSGIITGMCVKFINKSDFIKIWSKWWIEIK